MKSRHAFKPSEAASLFTTPASAARETRLFRRLTPDWQDEGALIEGLGNGLVQAHLVIDAKLAERRRLILTGMVKWQLRLAGGK